MATQKMNLNEFKQFVKQTIKESTDFSNLKEIKSIMGDQEIILKIDKDALQSKYENYIVDTSGYKEIKFKINEFYPNQEGGNVSTPIKECYALVAKRRRENEAYTEIIQIGVTLLYAHGQFEYITYMDKQWGIGGTNDERKKEPNWSYQFYSELKAPDYKDYRGFFEIDGKSAQVINNFVDALENGVTTNKDSKKVDTLAEVRKLVKQVLKEEKL